MIDIINIHKSYGSLEVLKGINAHIGKGEIVSIVGPSGAGKTTLLQIIGTLDKPDSGEIHIGEVQTGKLKTIGIAFVVWKIITSVLYFSFTNYSRNLRPSKML